MKIGPKEAIALESAALNGNAYAVEFILDRVKPDSVDYDVLRKCVKYNRTAVVYQFVQHKLMVAVPFEDEWRTHEGRAAMLNLLEWGNYIDNSNKADDLPF